MTRVCEMCPTARRSRCADCRGVHKGDTLVHPTSRYEADPAAQMIASLGGVTLEFIGDAMGISRERVRQIEAAALAKLGPMARRIVAEDM